jgi:hypothetical protein
MVAFLEAGMTRVGIERLLRAVRTYRWIAAAVVLLTTVAAFRPESSIVLLVRNDNASAARVFVGDGSWKYVGQVRSRSVERFEVPPLGQSGAPLRLLAMLGRDTVRAGPLTVLAGQSILFTLHEDASRSSAVVR